MSVLWHLDMNSKKEPALGGYVLKPRGDGYFDYFPRQGVIIPDDQRRLANEVSELGRQVCNSHLPKEHEFYYLEGMQRIFNKGCVKEGPEPKIALTELGGLRATFLDEKYGAGLGQKRIVYTRWAFGLLSLSALAGIALRAELFSSLPVSHVMIANYSSAWAAAMAAQVLLELRPPRPTEYDEYAELDYQLSRPVVRIFGVGLLAIAAAYLLSIGIITIRIGHIDTTNVEGDAHVAIAIGAIAGLLSSELLKIVLAKLKRALGG